DEPLERVTREDAREEREDDESRGREVTALLPRTPWIRLQQRLGVTQGAEVPERKREDRAVRVDGVGVVLLVQAGVVLQVHPSLHEVRRHVLEQPNDAFHFVHSLYVGD